MRITPTALLLAVSLAVNVFSAICLHDANRRNPHSAIATPHLPESPLAREERLALAGDTQSAFLLASRYLTGDRVPQNLVTAYAWLILSQRNESLRDQTAMLRCYHDAVNPAQRDEARQLAAELWQKMPH